MPKLTFNILTFNHPTVSNTFYFTKEEDENLHRVHKNLVPDEVIEEFGEKEHYYTSYILISNRNIFQITYNP